MGRAGVELGLEAVVDTTRAAMGWVGAGEDWADAEGDWAGAGLGWAAAELYV